MTVYLNEAGPAPPGADEERPPLGFRKALEAIKNGVGIGDAARYYGEFREAGSGRLMGRCLSPDHEDKTPSKSVYEAEGRFKCYGCGAHGDVLDLVMLVERCELWVALMILSERHGVELPGRPESWFLRQERQKPARDLIDRALFDHFHRRLFRRFFAPYLEVIEDRNERNAEAERLWDAAERLTLLMAERMMGAQDAQ